MIAAGIIVYCEIVCAACEPNYLPVIVPQHIDDKTSFFHDIQIRRTIWIWNETAANRNA